jgi:hypothetical protein
MKCGVCGINELITDDEILSGVCRDCNSSFLTDDDISI